MPCNLPHNESATITAVDRTQTYILVGVAALIAVVVSTLLILGSKSQTTPTGATLEGLQESTAPWRPEYTNLASRIKALDLPPTGSERYHVHARLAIYIDGQPQAVPGSVGVDSARGTASSLHTHDPDGIIHMEADNPRDFTLGEFFSVWGVKFSDNQLGGYKNSGDKTVQVFVNGQKITDPYRYVLKEKDTVIVGYGNPDSFPKTLPTEFPKDL